MIYEAFRSETVSKVNKFLLKKVGKSASDSFIRDLKSIQKIFDFPISEIKDKDIKYMSAKKALKIKAPDNWTPSSENIAYDVYAFKFWFSVDSGFLGKTGIGMKEMEYTEGDKAKKNKPFNEQDLDYIKNNLNIKKGKLKTVTNYRNLKHGQEIIGFFTEFDDYDKLTKAKLFIDGNALYAIQETSFGGSPVSSSWRDWGTYSWSLGKIDDFLGPDHKKLHIYTKTDDDLHIEENANSLEKNPLNWNLPVDSKYLNSWSYYDKSIVEIVENADFCIMFNIDDVIKSGYKKVSGIKKEREEDRKGATALYTDEEMKNLNIDRYMTAIIDKMGISIETDVNDLKKLEKVVKVAICDKFPIYSLYSTDVMGFLKRFASDLKDVIGYKGYESEFNTLKDRFIRLKKENSSYSKLYQKSEKLIFDSENEDLIDIFNKIKSISDKINKYINNQNIKTISDLKSVYYKLKYIINIFNDYETGDLYTHTIIKNMYDPNDIKRYIEHYSEKIYLDKDKEKLKNIERYIDSVLN